MTLRDRRRHLRSAPTRRLSPQAALLAGLVAGVAGGWLAGLVRVRKP